MFLIEGTCFIDEIREGVNVMLEALEVQSNVWES